MTTMNIQLSNAISDISGVTGQAIIRAILAGERNPAKLAKLRDRRIRGTEEEVSRSLEGNWREDMLFELRQAVAAYDFIQKQMTECDSVCKRSWPNCPREKWKPPEERLKPAGHRPGRRGLAGRTCRDSICTPSWRESAV
jgi:hypothetical protein